MPETDLALLIRAARGAGEIALRYAGHTAKRWEKPGGAGPVTEADLAVNDYLAETLRAARPDYGWLSEETEDSTARLSAKTVFIVDPIDGTRSFIEGGRTWAHSIAIAHEGVTVAGVVFLPARDRLFSAAKGEGAALNGAPVAARQTDNLRDAQILAARPITDQKFWNGPVPEFVRAYRPSLAYRMALVGQGRFDGMITFRPTWEWDIAAGSLIASEAGATVTDRRGATLQFNKADPRTSGVISAAPNLHRALARAHNSADGE
ncbi:3'(2'),5'-bisphosphate nucleotidase CysQ [Aliishimia ponticola]|uniref:3'(2'),5'-bisphosphate nucleotidase CysQ n=1 Tax=Aliishimia ponticola TaxID=2499833 RepID=A0A4V3XKE6_9RHOB|nr:3'(2'),5'-bisphosphate nucleotidase CysQ [Aliishimia ponticola]THH36613.1 3'(2'),5'-bisphosphate nucleotidase CysQ [Aliishimia ponticola]